jgi:hypothetical protein
MPTRLYTAAQCYAQESRGINAFFWATGIQWQNLSDFRVVLGSDSQGKDSPGEVGLFTFSDGSQIQKNAVINDPGNHGGLSAA